MTKNRLCIIHLTAPLDRLRDNTVLADLTEGRIDIVDLQTRGEGEYLRDILRQIPTVAVCRPLVEHRQRVCGDGCTPLRSHRSGRKSFRDEMTLIFIPRPVWGSKTKRRPGCRGQHIYPKKNTDFVVGGGSEARKREGMEVRGTKYEVRSKRVRRNGVAQREVEEAKPEQRVETESMHL